MQLLILLAFYFASPKWVKCPVSKIIWTSSIPKFVTKHYCWACSTIQKNVPFTPTTNPCFLLLLPLMSSDWQLDIWMAKVVLKYSAPSFCDLKQERSLELTRGEPSPVRYGTNCFLLLLLLLLSLFLFYDYLFVCFCFLFALLKYLRERGEGFLKWT